MLIRCLAYFMSFDMISSTQSNWILNVMAYTKNLFSALFITFTFIIPISCWAQSHCQPDEMTIISGKVGKLTKEKFSGEKILSLCADKETPPFSKLIYRFGPAHKVEMEYTAPVDGSFYSTNQEPLPRALLEILYFKKAKFTYAIVKCNGMHCGVRNQRFQLQVFNDNKRIVTLDSEPEKFDLKTEFADIKGKVIAEKNSDLDFDIESK